MKKSPNQIRVELKEIAAAHLQVNSFHWGDLQDATSKEVIYPLMNCYYPNGTLNNNRTSLQLVIEVYDLLYKDGSNLNDVESDTLQVIRDIYQVVNKSTRWKKIGKVSNSTVTKHKWGTADVVAGHSITINFDLRDVSGVCDLPIQDYDFDQQVPAGACPQVRVINTDLSYDQSVPAGDVLELQDNGYDITNSEGNTIISGSEVAQNDINKELPNVTHTDSDGSPVVYPSAKAFVCTPAAGCTGIAGFKGSEPYYTLPSDNLWGNSFRFCGTTGGYTDGTDYFDVDGVSTTKALAFPDGLICDLYRVTCDGDFLMFQDNFVLDSGMTLADAVTFCSSFTLGGFADWIQIERDHYDQIRNNLTTYILDNKPFENTNTAITLWTNTTFFFSGTDTRAWVLTLYGGEDFRFKAQASARPFPVRITNISEL